MSKLTQINSTVCSNLRDEINEAIQMVANKYGIEIKAGSAKYSTNTAEFKLNVSIVDANGIAQTPEVRDFNHYCTMFGLKKEHLGQTITISGEKMKIVGLKSANRKYPIIAECIYSNKRYKLNEQTVRSALGV